MNPLNFHPDALQKARAIADGLAAKLRKPEMHRKSGVLAAADEGVSELYLYDVIGGFWGGIDAEWLRSRLDTLKGAGTKRLNIFVNSPGGDVFESKAMLSLLQRFKAEKVVYVDGLIASAATFVAMAADRIVTAPHATWMIHEAWGWAGGNAKAMREYAELLEMVSGDIAGIYAARTKQPLAKLLELMAAETWMTAAEAKDLGFTDSVATFDEDHSAPAKDDGQAAAKLVRHTAAIIETHRASLTAFRAQQIAHKNKKP